MKKKWSFRSISFSKKDKNKPAREEAPKNGDVTKEEPLAEVSKPSRITGILFFPPPLSPSSWNNESRKKFFSRARIVGIDEYDSIYPKARIWRSSNCCFQAVRLATFPT